MKEFPAYHRFDEGESLLEPAEVRFYTRMLRLLNNTGIPYGMAGAFGVYAYTGIWRNTNDMDVYLKPDDLKTALDTYSEAGFAVEVTDGSWLAKVYMHELHMDLIFATANHLCVVDDLFLHNRRPFNFLGVESFLLSPEGIIASKAHIARSYRFDGADILHLVRSAEGRIDWQHLLSLLKNHSILLLWHLILVDFVYPGHTELLPRELMIRIFNQVQNNWANSKQLKSFRGTVIDPSSFAIDRKLWGYSELEERAPLVDEKGELLRGSLPLESGWKRH